MLGCCFGKRAWLGLGLLAAGLLIASPHLGWVALPVLAGLACPLSMLLMARGMRRAAATGAGGAQAAGGGAAADRAAEITRLRREIGQLAAEVGEASMATRGD